MSKALVGFVRTTLVGGITFLLPIVLIAWLFQKAVELAKKLAEPATRLLPESLSGGVVIGALETALAVLIVAFAAGLFARTSLGQRFMAWVENSLIGSLPQFNFVRGFAESVDDDDAQEIEVVLVPADAGWALGFIFEPSEAATVAVFIPGAPQWTSGSVVIAERASIRPAGIEFAQAVKILRKLGVGSDTVTKGIAAD